MRLSISSEFEEFPQQVKEKQLFMEEKAGYGKLDSWARQSLGIALDADFSISEEHAQTAAADAPHL